MTKKRATPKEFVKTWQTSSTVDEVMRKLDMKKESVMSRAYNYRQKGVPLKKLRALPRVDWGEIAEYAELFSKDENTEK